MESLVPGVMKITTPEGTDYVFMSPDEDITFKNADVSFRGRCGAIRIFKDQVDLVQASSVGQLQYHSALTGGIGPVEELFTRAEAEAVKTTVVSNGYTPLSKLPVTVTGERTELQPGVTRVTMKDGMAWLFDSPTVLDFQQDGVTFHGHRGAVVRQGETMRYAMAVGPGGELPGENRLPGVRHPG